MNNTDIHIYSVLCPQFLEVLYYYQIYPENHWFHYIFRKLTHMIIDLHSLLWAKGPTISEYIEKLFIDVGRHIL